jgi:tetratricopeptide (TPR) repeat protein
MIEKEYIKQGKLKAKVGDFKGAIQDYSRAIKINPSLAESYTYRCGAHCEMGDYASALDDSNKAIMLNPDDAMAYTNRGGIQLTLGNYRAAIDDCTKAISIDPKTVLAYVNRGSAKGELGEYKEAIDDYTRVIQLAPAMTLAYVRRGNIKMCFGDYTGAAADWERAIELNPSEGIELEPWIEQAANIESTMSQGQIGPAKLLLGIALEKMGVKAQAVKTVLEQIGKPPPAIQAEEKPAETVVNAKEYISQANKKYSRGDFQGAIADWEKAIATDPLNRNDLQMWIDLAKAKSKTNPD